MPRDIQAPEVTEIDRYGETITEERHPAFGLIGASRGQAAPPGYTLFDSELPHRNVVTVTVREAKRERALNHDRISGADGRVESTLAEVTMSEAQWAAFVSSMNTGEGVPCTIQSKKGDWQVPGLPSEARLQESMGELHAAGKKAISKIDAALKAVEEKPTKANIRSLRAAVDNAPGNMTFAAKSLSEHAENVVTKARHDIESMVIREAERRGLNPADIGAPQLTVGEDDIEEAEVVPEEVDD